VRKQTMTDTDLRPGPKQPDRLVRRPELLERLSISKWKLEQLIEDGVINEPICMGPRTFVWMESEVQSFLSQMAKERRLPPGNQF